MIYYIYDGSFNGLLTSIYEAYYIKEKPNKIICNDECQENILIKKIYITTDMDKANKVYEAIKNKISNRALRNIFYTYLSEFENVGIWIYEYIKLGFEMGKNFDDNLSDDRVLKIMNIRKKVSRQHHFMLGLIRFKCLKNNIYYATIEPDYNILGLLAPHFSERMSNENWVIHDLKRGFGAVYNKNEWIIMDIDFSNILNFHEKESFYQELWKEYFDSMAIKNRINLKLQKKNMPMKYWKHLVEKS